MDKEITPWGYPLWKHMLDEYNLILLESEIQEIVRIAKNTEEDSNE